MSKADLYREKADEMNRLAEGSITDLERRSYADMAAAWADLAEAALAIEARDEKVVVPFRPRADPGS
jgi:hypothetical protein